MDKHKCPACHEPVPMENESGGYLIRCSNKQCELQPCCWGSEIKTVVERWEEIREQNSK